MAGHDELQETLTRLRRRNAKAAKYKQDSSLRYAYLQRVLRQARKLRKASNASAIAAELEIRVPADVHSWIDGLMKATSVDDRRLRAKHAAALKYVAVVGVPSAQTRATILQVGGFNVAADLYRMCRAMP